ncbi:MBL fold metallo-hydrolase [Streptomyces sp. NPDC002588]|uniref:MBL fold metallo-hydrolase n=1 Tax=Streptomyces sp. NPDC002588 TaxID=3154419 RepID=UPI00332AF5DE
MAARIEHLVTSATVSLDGGTWDVDNNVWIVGDDEAVIVIDAAHDAEAIRAAVGDRRLRGIGCTHGHDDHMDAAPALADSTGCADPDPPRRPAAVETHHPDRNPDGYLTDMRRISVADFELTVLHTPGHTAPRPHISTSGSTGGTESAERDLLSGL